MSSLPCHMCESIPLGVILGFDLELCVYMFKLQRSDLLLALIKACLLTCNKTVSEATVFTFLSFFYAILVVE